MKAPVIAVAAVLILGAGMGATAAENAKSVIDYRVPPDKFDELAQYDGSVIAERTKGTLAARCDKEEMNFLALNLAHDVATGRKTVAAARKEYADTAMAFMKGEKRPYTQKLQFDAMKGTGDPDQPAPMK